MVDVITLGSATIDLNMIFNEKYNSIKVGDKVLINEIYPAIGGGAVNSALSLSNLGIKTAFLGKIGSDSYSELILSELKKNGVKVLTKNKSKQKTSFSVVLRSKKERDRIIFSYKGASDDLTTKDFEFKELKPKYFYVGTLLGNSFETLKNIVKYANNQNRGVLFNPSSYLAKYGKKKLKPVLQNTSILVLNLKEASILLNLEKKYSKEHDCDFNKLVDVLNKLYLLGPKIVIVTLGKKGSICYDGKWVYRMGIYSSKVVSLTGAGDYFASGFLAGLIKYKDISTALKIGTANATYRISHYGQENQYCNLNYLNDYVHKTRLTCFNIKLHKLYKS